MTLHDWASDAISLDESACPRPSRLGTDRGAGVVPGVERAPIQIIDLTEVENGMTRHQWRILPVTALGKWSVGLVVTMPILFVIGSSLTNSLYATIPAGDTVPADLAARPALALAMLAGIAAGISAFITGLLALIWRKDNALLIYVSTVIGGLLLLFLAGEILFPH